MKEYPFNTAYTQMSDLYGIEILPDDFENIGMIAWTKIGNTRTKMYRFTGTPEWDCDTESFVLSLPCNCFRVESVHRNIADHNKSSSTDMYPEIPSTFIENYVERRKENTQHLYTKGEYLNYEEVGDRLYFEKNYGPVTVAFKGLFLDEDGLPYLTDKEIDAIACYCAYASLWKQAIMTRDGSTSQIAMKLEQDWKRMCDAARVGSGISQNSMDEILDVRASWDRKAYNKSFKPTR